jgi:hypothetical protein
MKAWYEQWDRIDKFIIIIIIIYYYYYYYYYTYISMCVCSRDRLCGLATDPEVRVRFSALPYFLRSVSLERGPLSLVSTTEELLERKSSGFGLENRE